MTINVPPWRWTNGGQWGCRWDFPKRRFDPRREPGTEVAILHDPVTGGEILQPCGKSRQTHTSIRAVSKEATLYFTWKWFTIFSSTLFLTYNYISFYNIYTLFFTKYFTKILFLKKHLLNYLFVKRRKAWFQPVLLDIELHSVLVE